MRSHRSEWKSYLSLLIGTAMAFWAASARADIVINRFDTASEASQWRFDFGKATNSFVFDPSVDANTNASSGSLKITVKFNTALSDNNKAAFTRDISPAIYGPNVPSLEMDVLVEPNSARSFFGVNANRNQHHSSKSPEG